MSPLQSLFWLSPKMISIANAAIGMYDSDEKVCELGRGLSYATPIEEMVR
jgi:hypothetical protein